MRLSKPKVDDIINIVERWPKQKKNNIPYRLILSRDSATRCSTLFCLVKKNLQHMGMNKRNLQTDFPKWFDFAKIFNEMHVSAYSLSLSENVRQ